MRLSELNTDEGLDVLCELTPYVAAISADEDLIGELRRKVKLSEKATRAEVMMVGVQKISVIAPILLKKRREDVLAILGILNHKTTEEIAKQNFLVTLKQISDVAGDKEFINFFRSFGKQEGNG